MDFDTGRPVLPVKDFPSDSSWVPTTPVKPSLTSPKPICTNRQENEAVCADWLESQLVSQGNQEGNRKRLEIESLPGRFVGDTHAQNVAACCESTDYVNISRAFDSWEAGVAANSQLYGANAAIFNKLSVDDADTWTNVSFADLLAFAHAAAAPTGCNATTSSFTPTMDSQIEGSQSQNLPANSSLPNQELLHATKFWTNYDQISDIDHYGSSIASRQSFDLNSPRRTVSEVALGEGIQSQFAPITPDQATRACKEQVSDVPETTHSLERGLSVRDIELDELQKNEQSQLLKDQSCATISTELQENHAPDKGGSQGCDLNMTPHQKPRRKKHRPKVVIEGQPKRTPKPRTPKPAAPEGTVPGKRKYVRRNGGSKITAVPTENGNDRTASTAKPPAAAPEGTVPVKRKYVRRNGGSKITAVPTENGNDRTASTAKPPAAAPEGTMPVKRKYVRRNGGNKITATPTENANDKTASTAKLPASTETPGKRKYVRRKGVHNPAATPSEDGISRSDQMIGRHTKTSCRRSLNFDFESQVRDDNSSCGLPSNSNNETCAQNFSAEDNSSLNKQLQHATKSRIGKTELGIADDLTCSQASESYISVFERQAPGLSTPLKNHPTHDKSTGGQQNECTTGKPQIVFSDATHHKEVNVVKMMTADDQCLRKRPNSSNCSSSACFTQETQARESKRQHFYLTEAEYCSTNVTGAHYNSLQTYLPFFSPSEYNRNGASSMLFPAIHKKMTDGHKPATCRVQSAVAAAENCSADKMSPVNDTHRKLFASESIHGISAAQYDSGGTSTRYASVDYGAQDEKRNFNCLLALGDDQRLTKRSKGPTQSRPCEQLLTSVGEETTPGKVQAEVLDQPQRCMEDLVAHIRATVATKKQSRRESSIGSSLPNLYNQHQSLKMAPPLAITWKALSPIDEMIERFSLLDIDAQSSQFGYQEQNALIAHQTKYPEQNALVVYQRDGSIVPFKDSFKPARKRKPRPKVNLDDETSRVWKLLLEDINKEGIDGTDDEKAKWWEEERRVFRGRTDSFIARMHLIQGDRRFSPWKGSVVDSVVGVFLTQNVSDHLSSSAFMSLAAQYPLKSKSNHKESHEEQTGITEEPEVHVLDADDTIAWHEEKPNQSTCGQGYAKQQYMEHDREKEAANDSECPQSSSCGTKSTDNSMGQLTGCSTDNLNAFQEPAVDGCQTLASSVGDQTELDDILSSQNSVDSSDAQTEKSELCSLSTFEGETTSETKTKLFSGSNSFVELLQMAGTTMLLGVCNQRSGKGSFNINGSSQSENDACISENKDWSYDTEAFTSHITPGINSSSHVIQNPGAQGSRSSERELCAIENSELSAESANQTIFERTRTDAFEEVPKSSSANENASDNHQIEVKLSTNEDPEINTETQIQLEEGNYKIHQALDSQHVSLRTSEVRERSIIADNSRDPNKKSVQSSLSVCYDNLDNTVDAEKASTSKAKRGRTGKEQQKAVDWDSLRKEAQANGKKRERTAGTMDSLDWEAIRCADVKEIADAIKARGMNNKLAERIKDFLNRLVREHGSTDLEWLRDVPPDKAKEYLLSIRGLGLKSVECVRLLTLHHLAFPVDTNVGRIAVRLGWVPLQPLPESLQLHLLEMYPVLESIQKYLWPRLCKLDQRTLYELHYQMITFGKVFCTKSKPNCNGCPMRGECRHFASAFASARFALPAPEEKTIASAADNQAADQNSVGYCSSSKLCLPQANEQNSLAICSSSTLCLPQAKEQLRAHFEIGSSNPIVEVPATPEPTIEEPATPEADQTQVPEPDIEDFEDPDEIPTIRLNMEEFTQNLQMFVGKNMELQEHEMSKALVALSAEATSIPAPKLKNTSRLRTEHHVYELPDSHPLLQGLDRREPDDPCPYLLAIWTPGETANSVQPPESRCSSQECGRLCHEETCFSCNSLREANSQTVRGTLLIPCRTAMRGSFPLNGTYFQVNEVFADHESSINPIDVPRAWIWNLPRRTVYFGTSTPTIFRGLSTEEIQYCFWRGFVCVRGFEQKTRAPRPLMARFHFPASKMTKTKGRINEDD